MQKTIPFGNSSMYLTLKTVIAISTNICNKYSAMLTHWGLPEADSASC